MTKKYFEALTKTLKRSAEGFAPDTEGRRAVAMIVYRIAYVYADFNPNFDRKRFIEAATPQSE